MNTIERRMLDLYREHNTRYFTYHYQYARDCLVKGYLRLISPSVYQITPKGREMAEDLEKFYSL